MAPLDFAACSAQNPHGIFPGCGEWLVAIFAEVSGRAVTREALVRRVVRDVHRKSCVMPVRKSVAWPQLARDAPAVSIRFGSTFEVSHRPIRPLQSPLESANVCVGP